MTDYEIEFAVYCDGPLNSYLAGDKDELYKDHTENVERYGICKDLTDIESALENGLNPTLAMSHIIEVFVKNYKNYNPYKYMFETFAILITSYSINISEIIHALMSFDDIDDYYPTYLEEYKDIIIVRMDILDCLYKLLNSTEYIEKVKEYADWKNIGTVSSTIHIEINMDNCIDVYFVVMKNHSNLLKTIE